MAGNRNSGNRRRAKTLAEHKRDGTYRPSRHAHLVDPATLVVPPKPPTRIVASVASQQRFCRNEADHRAVRNGCRFNERLVDHVVEFFRRFLRHSKGRWAGQPFELNNWQIENIIAPIFGWVREDGTRRTRSSYIEIAKKNYKSQTAAGIGLYMLVGDGEPGAEVYSVAADKDQAKITHGEAVRMVEASPELEAGLSLNRTTSTITHEPSSSSYKALSATPQGKHGYSVHCGIYDELHQWHGRELWDTLRYASRARSQPLSFVITNSGDDKGSVCYQQHQLSEAWQKGEYLDDAFYSLILAATAEEAEAEITAVATGDLSIPVARRCNPALGDVISEADIIRDIRAAIQTPSEKPNLLRLTYGIWANTGSTPWLQETDWKANAQNFTETSLHGQRCYGGLDIATVFDMTALSLCFPPEIHEGAYRLLLYFWLPEDGVNDPTGPNFDLYQHWLRLGVLRTTPGRAIQHDFIRRDIREIFSRFSVQEYAFDPRGAEKLTQEITDGILVAGQTVEQGSAVERVQFPQSVANYTEATKEFERLLVSRRLQHNDHPILTWQAGHVTVIRDAGGGMKPVKPDEVHLKIDGIQASVMALALAMRGKVSASVYEDRGLYVL